MNKGLQLTNIKRLPAVLSLSKILPAGTEGGKEFARIIGLLLFNNARKNNTSFFLFDDASGDFEGLDGYSRKNKSKDTVGYQYKFYPSPLSDAHRVDIKKSLANALERTNQLKLKKWILVTPDDLKNSATRRDGGDVSWFEKLREENSSVEIEHFGHTKILSLFLEAQFLCLYYYPSLIISGVDQQKSIQECRAQYDDNMRKRYGRIEFVGMSVYKEEASRRIPLEKIYIPLSVVPERSVEETEDTPRMNPLVFLKPGAKNIILGDPGSGKSTLLGFLALAGINKDLQVRCDTVEDSRLTVVVTLRRYADELKSRKNLPLLDYILEVARADFSMGGLSQSFFSYYVESGQAIILFDGLDELPSKEFKSIIRQRIDSFVQGFPANTVIVTSRLVGYDAEIRFDESYGHFRVAKLKVNEIEKFIVDWYTARIDDSVEKDRNAADLIKIITLPDSDSIRALARNPLLLTIVALVHRIDAVLPDQRVVLYQKCTETLLNTWYKAKRQDEDAVKGRIERRNRLRVEAIAYWMHRRSLKGKGRSVAPREELISFLTDYIASNETIRPMDDLAEDQAEVFVDFIRNSAGLLIEAGDGLYSFIHLTFQEYLCATHLAAFGERDGTLSIWKELRGDLQNPRWREVVRLLVASLRSTQAQAYFVDKLLDEQVEKKRRDTCLLLLGLLRDGIEPAEIKTKEIIEHSIDTLLKIDGVDGVDDVRVIINSMLNWLVKELSNVEACIQIWGDVYAHSKPEERVKMLLLATALVLHDDKKDLVHLLPPPPSPEYSLVTSLLYAESKAGQAEVLSKKLFHLSVVWGFHSPGTNLEAVLTFCTSILLDGRESVKRMFLRELTLLGMPGHGPHGDNGVNIVSIASAGTEYLPQSVSVALETYIDTKNKFKIGRDFSALEACIDENLKKMSDKRESVVKRRKAKLDHLRAFAKDQGISHKLLKPFNSREIDENAHLIQTSFFSKRKSAPDYFWSMLRSSEIFTVNYRRTIELASEVKMTGLWVEALQTSLIQSVPGAITRFFSQKQWDSLIKKISLRQIDEEDIYMIAWLILFDIWVWCGRGYEGKESFIVRLTGELKTFGYEELVPIKLSMLIRDLVCQPTQEGKDRLSDYWQNNLEAKSLLADACWGLR
ncbi:NACHT domain-containing protein [Pseudomonas sp. A-RE-19]|uniref:NACHT domain-containing protein n=1 Tax=Pseudomonas sp. A-RE-19 TaxID=2832401 RepID=UPI001CBB5956|nr:NACHT domain-containing protein [Pseudomonas sp. A-RE-19]